MENPFNLFKPKKSTHSIPVSTPEEVEEVEKITASNVTKKLKKYTRMDKEARLFYRDYSPPISVETIKGKEFVTIGDIEFCADYVSDISVHEQGEKPETKWWPSMYNSSISIYAASPAIIRVSYFSGRHIDIECNRHALEPLLIAVRDACKEALRNSKPVSK